MKNLIGKLTVFECDDLFQANPFGVMETFSGFQIILGMFHNQYVAYHILYMLTILYRLHPAVEI